MARVFAKPRQMRLDITAAIRRRSPSLGCIPERPAALRGLAAVCASRRRLLDMAVPHATRLEKICVTPRH